MRMASLRLASLEEAVCEHTGQFLCERINAPSETKIVAFRHVVHPPVAFDPLPKVGRLSDFYETFGSVVFDFDEQSGDAAKCIASPSDWGQLSELFDDWVAILDEQERGEVLPDWIDDCLVIGEEPHTGNYILMPTAGDASGRVFLFDHDGFEFFEEAEDLIQYVKRLLSPDDDLLRDIASHMRFAEGDRTIQWWIRELRDNRGNVARTPA
jgi:hypothetical protein